MFKVLSQEIESLYLFLSMHDDLGLMCWTAVATVDLLQIFLLAFPFPQL
jgi:hypothetical protein